MPEANIAHETLGLENEFPFGKASCLVRFFLFDVVQVHTFPGRGGWHAGGTCPESSLTSRNDAFLGDIRLVALPCFTYIWVILLVNIGKYTIFGMVVSQIF